MLFQADSKFRRQQTHNRKNDATELHFLLSVAGLTLRYITRMKVTKTNCSLNAQFLAAKLYMSNVLLLMIIRNVTMIMATITILKRTVTQGRHTEC